MRKRSRFIFLRLYRRRGDPGPSDSLLVGVRPFDGVLLLLLLAGLSVLLERVTSSIRKLGGYEGLKSIEYPLCGVYRRRCLHGTCCTR